MNELRDDWAGSPWHDASKELPPEGVYVLVHLVKDNWLDSTDPKGVYFKVAKLEKGITEEERGRMIAGELPDPEEYGWTFLNGKPTRHATHRSSLYKAGDQHWNNLRPYCWNEFGPGKYFGQEVDYWMRIPEIKL